MLVAMTPATLHERSTRDRILACAVEIVASEGVAALGVREVARRAGVSHNAPSRHFPTHAALCSAVATVGFTEFCAALETSMAAFEKPFDRLCAQARAYVRFAHARPGMFELMWRHDLLEHSDDALAMVALRSFALLRDAIVVCQSCGWNADVEPDTMAGILWAWVHGLAQLWLTGGMPIFAMPLDLDAHLRAGFNALGLPTQE
jgi:AcrR family transcriptional regulator